MILYDINLITDYQLILFYCYSFNISDVTNRVILAPTNNKSDEINEMAANIMPGQAVEIKSLDEVVLDSQQALFPTEFLNTLNLSGLPPHNLKLKVGLPIIMLRNLNPNEGLCNGTRLIIKNIFNRLIEAEI